MRRPNRKTTREPFNPNHGLPAIVLEFSAFELSFLKRNRTSAGFQDLENLLLDLTDRETRRCPLTPDQHDRLQRCCKTWVKNEGGPQDRIRNACIPALRRLGFEMLPEFSSQYVRKVSPDDPRLVVRKHASHAE